jgi:hypothetical protein
VGALGALSITPVAATAASAASGIIHAPNHRVLLPNTAARNAPAFASTNWSGYALQGTSTTYHSITGAWAVPTITPSSSATYSSHWIGIDGFSNSHLIQTGTEADSQNGTTTYDAWWEILPKPETVIPSMPVHPGDQFTASITKKSGSNWVIKITNITQNVSFSITKSYSGPGTSAEWIVERPEVGGTIAPLANYGTVTFNKRDTVNGGNPNLSYATDSIEMLANDNTTVISTPSTVNAEGNGFRTAYGSTAPAPPS